jgi:hypothetical protein
MSNINTTIAENVTVQPCRPPVPPTEIRPTAAAFFLDFACTTVDPSLTDPKSYTYETTSHGYTGPVHLYVSP